MRRALAVACGAIFLSTQAHATNVTEFPDNGSEQLGRGGAWLARASDPLATLYNPAGLAGQPTRLTLQVNLPFQQTCFHRTRDASDTTQDMQILNGSSYPGVCNDLGTFPVPALGLTLRVTPRLGIGVLLTAPSGTATQAWPELVQTSSGTYYPAPERYLDTYSNAVFLEPTVGAGWEPVDNLRIGASFVAGIASATYSNGSISNNASNQDPRANDIKATLTSQTVFVPGFTVGALWSASRMLDVAAWYKWSAPVDGSADLKTYANYYQPSTAVVNGDTTLSDCGVAGTPAGTCHPGIGHIKLPIPMEAKIGVRIHQPRGGVSLEDKHRRDPMAQDVWDLSFDLTWANDSAIDYLTVTFPGTASAGVIPVAGTPGTVPANANIPHFYNDVVGARLGGDWNVLANRLALRAGAFAETQAASTDKNGNATYMATDFMAGAHVGLALGATLRIPLKKNVPATEGGALELSLGYMHMFVTDLHNDGSSGGIRALAGTACSDGNNTSVNAAGVCDNGVPSFRSPFYVNLGTITNSLDVVNVGASYRF